MFLLGSVKHSDMEYFIGLGIKKVHTPIIDLKRRLI